MKPSDLKKVLKINKNVEFKYLDNETFILYLDHGTFFKLDAVGTDIWRLIDGKRDVNKIIELLYGMYNVKKRDLENDVMAVIAKATKHGVLIFK